MYDLIAIVLAPSRPISPGFRMGNYPDVYGALELKTKGSGAPVRGNDRGKCLIAYQGLHKASKVLKGKTTMCFLKYHSTINKQVLGAN